MTAGQKQDNTVFVSPEQLKPNTGSSRLVIVEEGEFHEYDLASFGKERLFIGRDPEKNDIVLHSPIVSAVHAKIKLEGGRVYLADLKSKNGIAIKRMNRFEKIQPMKYYPLQTVETICRIDMPQVGREHTVVCFFSCQDTPGGWKQVDLNKQRLTIGRAQDNDIVLNHISVSRHHAQLQHTDSGMMIADNKSMNGVFINGARLSGVYKLCDKDIIQIAGVTMFVAGNRLIYKTAGSGINLETRDLCKTVDKGAKVLLDHVNCRIAGNEFVAIIGGSGTGKTTLMTALSGFDDRVDGTVLCNGINLHENFSALKNMIGFVPQQDIIYENLTLKKMLFYTAKMKMPEDSSKEELSARIDKVLEMVELTEHKDKYIRKLSGGQKKRASIAVELLADPGLFFLDEPTSGLDPGTEQKLMQTLSRLAKQEEKTIVMVTHTTQSLHLCDKIIIMGNGGRLCFAGTPGQAKRFFHTDDLVDIYNFVADDPLKWANQFKQLNVFSGQSAPPADGKIAPKHTNLLRQLSVLVMRYAELIWNDKQRLLLLLLQPLLVALLLNVVSGDQVFKQYEQTKSIMFALACSGIWIGMFNTIQEICKERVILKREYMGNLKLGMYILSKYAVQLVICLVQGLILSAVFLLLCDNHLKKGLFFKTAGVEVFITIFITIMASASIGLIVSAFMKNADRAMAVAPFLLIIQLLFSGILFSLKGMSKRISVLTVSRWSVESLGNIARLNKLPLRMQEEFPSIEHEAEAIFKHTKAHLGQTWMIMIVMTLVCAVVSTFVLRSLKNDQR